MAGLPLLASGFDGARSASAFGCSSCRVCGGAVTGAVAIVSGATALCSLMLRSNSTTPTVRTKHAAKAAQRNAIQPGVREARDPATAAASAAEGWDNITISRQEPQVDKWLVTSVRSRAVSVFSENAVRVSASGCTPPGCPPVCCTRRRSRTICGIFGACAITPALPPYGTLADRVFARFLPQLPHLPMMPGVPSP